MRTYCLFVVRMDIAHDKETLFNELYDVDIETLRKVPGVHQAHRCMTPNVAEPRYSALYEFANPGVFQTPEFRAAADKGRWKPEVRPHTMNHRHAFFTRSGGAAQLTYRTPYLYFDMRDVEPEREALFNELYESELLPAVAKISGVANVVRYRLLSEGHPRYPHLYEERHPRFLAIYEVEAPQTLPSDALTNALATPRWAREVQPYTFNIHSNLYQPITSTP